jgi:hypothetical protein
MDKGKEILSNEKRQVASKEVQIFFQDANHFNILNDEGKIKYIGKLDTEHPEQEMCTCPDQFFRNTENYRAENGYALQCKHLILAHETRGDTKYG